MGFFEPNLMKSPAVIAPNTANAILGIFNMAYKTGVMDAEDVGDAELYEGFAREVSVPGIYGRVTEYQRYSLHQWRIALLQMNRGSTMATCRILLSAEMDKSYVNCIFPLAQDFYLLGMRDYNANPTIHDFTLFSSRKMERWTLKGIQRTTKEEILIEIQEACLNRSLLDAENKNKFSFPRRKYEAFAERMWLALSAEGNNLYAV